MKNSLGKTKVHEDAADFVHEGCMGRRGEEYRMVNSSTKVTWGEVMNSLGKTKVHEDAAEFVHEGEKLFRQNLKFTKIQQYLSSKVTWGELKNSLGKIIWSTKMAA